MCWRFEVGDEEHESEQHQQGAGNADGQVGQGNDRQDRREPSHHARQDEAGIRELGDDAVAGHDDQQRRDGRVDERVQENLPERHGEVVDCRAGGVEDHGAVRALRLAVVDLAQQRADVRGLEVGDMERHRLLGIDVHALAHRLLRPVGVASVHRREVAHARDRIVEHLRAQVAGQVGTGGLDRVGGADVGARRHRQDVGRLGDEQARRCGASAARIHIDDDRHLGVEEARHDLIHGGRDAARRVDHDEEGVRAVGLGATDRGLDVGSHDRVDVTVEVRFLDVTR